MVKLSDNLESLKTFGTYYFREELFRPPPKVIKDVVYGKHDLQIGRRMNGSVYTLDLREACRILVVGATRCMPLGTLVKTRDGLVKIEEAKKVLSYDFNKEKVEEKECIVHNRSMQKLVKIKTAEGVIECSPEHKWFIKRDMRLRIIETKNLIKTDKLLKVDVSLQEIQIEDIEITNKEVEMVDLQVEDNENFILSNGILTHNSGKTFLIRSLSSRLNNIKKDIIFLSDPKDELKSSIDPVQEKFRDGLLPGEQPKGMKVVTLRPTFFKTIRNELAKRNFWYSVDMKQLTKSDFMTLLNSDELTMTQQVSMELIYQELSKRFKKDKELRFSVDLINDIIDNMSELSTTQANSLRFKFKPLEYSHFFVEKYQRSIVSLIQKGYVPAINMENFDSFNKGAFLFPEVTLGIILREIINARINNKLRPLWIFLDEATRFIGNRKKSSFKESVLESVDLHTRYNVNWVFCLQIVDDAPETILKQSKYILLPRSLDVSSIKSILINTGLTKNIQSAVNQSMRLKRMMKSVKYSWVIINRMEGTMELIVILPPLSNHMETSE